MVLNQTALYSNVSLHSPPVCEAKVSAVCPLQLCVKCTVRVSFHHCIFNNCSFLTIFIASALVGPRGADT